MFRLMRVWPVALILLTVGIGCDTLTRERFDTLMVNQSNKADVKQTLGTPSQEMDDVWHYERPEKHLNVMFDFNDDGVVTRKQWIDTAKGMWTDTDEPGDSSTSDTTTVRTKR